MCFVKYPSLIRVDLDICMMARDPLCPRCKPDLHEIMPAGCMSYDPWPVNASGHSEGKKTQH